MTDEAGLRNAVVLVTGAASGIGLASARAFAAAGARVIGTDVDTAAGNAKMAALGATFHPLDVRHADAWKVTVDAVVARHGRLDVVHLNAGVMTRGRGEPLHDDPLQYFSGDKYRRVFDVNVDGVIYGIAACLDVAGLRQIIVTASGAGLIPLAVDPFYTASKYAIVGLGMALAPTLAERAVRLDVLCPGAIDTQMTAPDVRDMVQQESASFIGDAAVELASGRREPGPIWMAFRENLGLQRYERPPVPGLEDIPGLMNE